MAKFVQTAFNGGISEGTIVGYENSYNDGFGIDYRTDRDRAIPNKRLIKDSGSTVTDLILHATEYNGDFFFLGDSGKVYKRTSAGTWSAAVLVGTGFTPSQGNGMEIFNDALWVASDLGISKFINLDTTLTAEGQGIDLYFVSRDQEVIQRTDQSAANTYTLQTSINEGATHRKTLSTEASDVYITAISALIVSDGGGDVTLTMHNSSNQSQGEVTVTTADLSTGSVTRFNFANPVLIPQGDVFHFHFTVSSGTTTVRTNTASTHETIVFYLLHTYDKNDVDTDQDLSLQEVRENFVYTTTTTNGRSPTDEFRFTPTTNYLGGISVQTTRWTSAAGDFTMELYDSRNNLVKSVTNEWSSTHGENFMAFIRFDFKDDPLKVQIGLEYVVRLSRENSAGTLSIVTSTNLDMQTASIIIHTQVIRDYKFHPMKVFLNKLCVGNGNFLLTVDDSEVLTVEALQFPPGENVRCLEVIGDFLAIAVTRGPTLDSYGTGRIYFWDGVSATYNSFIELDGQPNAIKNDHNKLAIVHGQGIISYYTGSVTKMRVLRDLKQTDEFEVLPSAICMHEGILRFAPSNNNSSDFTWIKSTVNSYGRKDKDQPMTLSNDFIISTGSQYIFTKIGCLFSVSPTKFFIAWEDDVNHGVDIIDTDNSCTLMFIESMIIDGGESLANIEKIAYTLSVRFTALASPQRVSAYYKINRQASWVALFSVWPALFPADIGATYRSAPFETTSTKFQRFFEIQIRVECDRSDSSAGTLPYIEGYELVWDVNQAETQLNTRPE